MDILNTVLEKMSTLIPTALTTTLIIFLILGARLVFNRGQRAVKGSQFRSQIILMLMSFAGLLVIVLTLPVSDSTIGQLLSLLGLLFSAAIALSATTFIGNIMAGLMLRAVKNFKLGDFVKVLDNFGRVTERGLFHIEIQTEDRDLTTLPNLYLLTNPVKVARSSGTLVSAEISLGYDIPRSKIEVALIEAAENVGLEDPFVHIVKLGDFSVTYKIAGLLRDLKGLLSTRSRLRAMSMDQLHAVGVEIVSPTFMNQRLLDKDKKFMAAAPFRAGESTEKELPESILFDKADEVESIEKLKERLIALDEEADQLKTARSDTIDENEKESLREKRDQVKDRIERLKTYITQREDENE